MLEYLVCGCIGVRVREAQAIMLYLNHVIILFLFYQALFRVFYRNGERDKFIW